MSLALRAEIAPLPILVIEQQTLLDQKHILLVVFTIEVMASMTEGKRQLSCLATKVIAIQCELANNHLNKFSYVSDTQGKKRHTIKSYFTYGSAFRAAISMSREENYGIRNSPFLETENPQC